MPTRTVTITINTEAELKGIGELIKGLEHLQATIASFGKGVKAFDRVTTSLKDLAHTMERVDKLGARNPLGKINTGVAALSKSIATMGKGGKSFTTMTANLNSLAGTAHKLEGLQKINLAGVASDMKAMGEATASFGKGGSGLTNYAKNLTAVVGTMSKLKDMKGMNMTKLSTDLTKIGTAAAGFSKGTRGFDRFGASLRSMTSSMDKLSKVSSTSIDNLPDKLNNAAAAAQNFKSSTDDFTTFTRGVSSMASSLKKLDELKNLNMKSFNANLRSSADAMDKFNVDTEGFVAFAKGIASVGKSMGKIKADGLDATIALDDFTQVVHKLDQALKGVPLDLSALAKGLRDSVSAVKSLDNQNRTQNTIKETTSEVKNLYNMWGKLTGRMTTVSTWGKSDDGLGNEINQLEKLSYMYEKLDNKGKVTAKGVSDESSIEAMNLTKNTWNTLGHTVESVQSKFRVAGIAIGGVHRILQTLGPVAQRLASIFNSLVTATLRLAANLTRLAGTAVSNALRGIGTFANNASSQFANLRKTMDANGGIFSRFQKHVTDSMAKSQRAIMQFYSSGWSFLVSGRMMGQAGQNIFQNLDSRLQEYTDYEKNLTRTAIAGATPYDANGKEITNMYDDAGEVNIPVRFEVDQEAVQKLIFGLQRGLYGPAVKNFSASDIAEGAYYFSSAVGTPITEKSLPDLGPLLTTLTQIANITRTSPETVTKGVINAATEFGIDPRDSANYAKLMDVASDMAYVSNVTTLEFPDIAESFKMVGPMADQLGITIDDAMSYIMELSDYGLRGSQVGRGLSMTMSRINDPTEKMMAITQEAYGTGGDVDSFRSLFMDEHGKLKGGLQGLLKTIQAGADEDHAAQFIAELFTENATRTTIAAVAAAMKDPKRFSSLQQILESDASLNYIDAAITANQSTLFASMQNFRNGFFQITAALVDNIKGPLMGALDGITNIFFKIADILKNNPAISEFIAGLTGLIGVILSVAGALFTAFGSMLLFSKAITMAAGSGFGVVRILKDMLALATAITPVFILLATLGSLLAIGWKEDFGGIRSALEGADVGKLMNKLASSITRNVKMIGGSYAELLRVLFIGSGTINNLETMLDRVFGDILGPIALHHILYLRDAMQGLREQFASLGKDAGGLNIGKMLGSVGGATQGFFEQIFTGSMQQGNFLEAQTLLRPILGPDWKASWNKAADTARESLGLVVSYFRELGSLVAPVLSQIAENIGQIFSNIAGADVSPLEVLKSFATGFAGGFATVILNIAKAFEALTGALADLHLDFITKYFNDGATAAGALAGVISGALIIGALTPGIGAFTGFGAAILDTAIKYGILGTAQLAFKAVAITLNAVAATLSATFAVLGTIIELGVALPFASLLVLFGLVAVAFYELWKSSDQFRANLAIIQENGMTLVNGFIAGFLDGLTALLTVIAAVVYVIVDLAAAFSEWGGAADTAYIAGYAVAGALGAIAVASIAASWEFWLIVAAVVALIAVLNKLGVLDEIATALKWAFENISIGISDLVDDIKSLIDYAGKALAYLDKRFGATKAEAMQVEIDDVTTTINSMATKANPSATADDMLAHPENYPKIQKMLTDYYKADHGGQAPDPTTGDLWNYANDTSVQSGKTQSNKDYFSTLIVQQQTNDPATLLAQSQTRDLKAQRRGLEQDQYLLRHTELYPKIGESAPDYVAPIQEESAKVQQSITDATNKASLGGVTDFITDLISGKLSPKEIMATMGWDMPDVKAMTGIGSMTGLTASDLFQPAIDVAQDEYIKEFYKAQTGNGLYRDIKGQWAVNTDTVPANRVRDQMGIGVGVTDAMGGQGQGVVNPYILQQAEQDAADTIADLTEEQKIAADNLAALNTEIGNFAQSISNIDLASALKGVFDSALGNGGVSAATVLNTYSDQIMSNLSTAVGGGELPWQNSFEMMMDAAGTGGGMGKNMNGKNLHKALAPYLQTFADQSGVDVNTLMKGVPMFSAPEELKGMGQTDLMQWADNLAPDQYKKLDLLGTNPYAHANSARAGEVFDAEGMDWTELMNFGTGQAAAGNADWNLTDYLMESWDLTKKQAEAYITDNGLDPNVINGAMFEDTQLLAASQNGLVNVITPEWMTYLNKVTQNGADKTIEITQEAFDKLPDVVKIGYSNMGYQFVIGGQETADQAGASTQMIVDQLGKQYPELAKMYDDLAKDLGTSDGTLGQYFNKSSWVDEFGNRWVTLEDEISGTTITIPEVDYEAYLASVRETLKGQEDLQAFLDKQKKQKEALDNLNIAHGGHRLASGETTGFQPIDDMGIGGGEAAPPAFDWSGILPDQATIDAATAQTTEAISTSFDTAIVAMLPTIGTSLDQLYTAVINKFLEMNSVIITVVPYIGATLPTNLTDVITPAAQVAAFNLNNVVTNEFIGLRNNVQNLTGDIGSTLVASLAANITPAYLAAFALGWNLGMGVHDGIMAAIPMVQAAMRELVASSNTAGVAAGIIMSPSHLTRDEIGIHLGTGIADGLIDSIPANQDAMQRVVTATSDIPSGGIEVGGAGSSNGGGVHYHIHVENMYAATGEEFLNEIATHVDRRLGEKQALQRRGMTAASEKQ